MFLFNPSLLRCYSVRPIFLGCCVLAVKVSREAEPRLSYLHSRVQDVFNLLDVTLLSRIEHQLLEVLSSQPAPAAPQRRPRISLPHSLCANALCRCWTGGCPWTPGNIKSTPTRSSARLRTRFSRRPCRTRARRGKLESSVALRSITNIFLATSCGAATAICALEEAYPFSSYLIRKHIRIHPLPLPDP